MVKEQQIQQPKAINKINQWHSIKANSRNELLQFKMHSLQTPPQQNKSDQKETQLNQQQCNGNTIIKLYLENSINIKIKKFKSNTMELMMNKIINNNVIKQLMELIKLKLNI